MANELLRRKCLIEARNRTLREARVQASGKPYGGTLQFWCRHQVRDRLPPDKLAHLVTEVPDFTGEFISAVVVEDLLGRWHRGDTMRTCMVLAFDDTSGLIETRNTLYQLLGPGREAANFPVDYASEAGLSMLLLSGVPKDSH